MSDAVPEKTLREKMTALVDSLPPDQVTLAEVLDRIGQEGWLLFCIFLTLPFMVPVSIPGVSTVFGAAILLIGISLTLNRTPWLPARLMHRHFPSPTLKSAMTKGVVWLTRLERISHPRLPRLARGFLVDRLNAMMLVLGAVLLMMPFGLVPFSNTLPGLAILFLAMGAIQKDGGCILLGYLTNLATIVYFGVLVYTGSEAVMGVVRKITALFQ
jgi:hypothetical protein